MRFRYDINALRGIAVMAVLLFHYKAQYFNGGFSGVDVFFVISGYLMTRIIITSFNENGFSLRDFYSKRVKRIIPALAALVAIITFVGFFIYFPIDFKAMGENSISSLLFVSNILYWQNSDYFAPASDSNILLHTWSLSVEWQFYIIYPIVLVWLNKWMKDKNRYLSIYIALTLILCIVSIAVTYYNPTASFYLLPTRAWEMMIGGLAFYGENRIKNLKLRITIALIGYALIFYCILRMDNRVAWPGVHTLIPTLGTCMVIIADWNDWGIIKTPVSRFFGKISYSLYLWHWPVFVIAKYVGLIGMSKNIIVLPSLMILSIGLAFLSYRYVESRTYSSRKIFKYSGGILMLTLLLMITNANALVFKTKSVELSNYARDHKKEMDAQFSTGKCFVNTNEDARKFRSAPCLCLSDSIKNILLIGDSHAAQLSSSLREVFSGMNIQLSQATASGCLPILPISGQSRCKDVINYVYYDYISKHASQINGVIICANWIDSHDDNATLVNNIKATLQLLDKYHIKAIIIGQNETYTMPYPYIAAWEYQLNIKLARKYVKPRSALVNDFLKYKLPSQYIDIYNSDSLPGISATGTPYMLDDHHVTHYGADLLIKKILSNQIAHAFLDSVARED
ncbi:acyltransferase family protein [Chitinophaga oryziterrae]|uniref:Acyltransferase family protein n=1 Tax=Chitinophaga oryziterrae TaxID=1031224 RepID=A0A6N8JK44_9BACT|nr:acyltransferase family protein [Chitinophaga oryziterrae]MVT44759.1 acyltransferase family protein [Chitinophaga oryziterrae]